MDVSYTDRSFTIDGRPVWLVSGTVDTFRVPEELWTDRLLKVKRAGLNCVSTRIAWNVHETAEGQWQFEHGRDLVEFVHLAADIGLMVIIRPGPFIDADWDFGGLPAWLNAKSGINYRTNNAAYTHYFDKYFAQVLGRLSDLQITQGGNIVLIQNEQDYRYTTQPDRTAYLDFITQLFRRAGFTIPIITSNHLTEPRPEEAIETVEGFDQIVPELRRLRRTQADAPLMVSDLHVSAPSLWGKEPPHRPAKEMARRALEVLGCGAQYNLADFHGGTNLAFWAGHLATSQHAFQTTTHDGGAPLGEGGMLRESYYDLRVVNLLASSLGPVLATGEMDSVGAALLNAPGVLNITGSAGQWAVVTNGGQDEIETIDLALPNGKTLTVDLSFCGALAVPFEMKLPGEAVLDYCSLQPLGLFGPEERSVLILHGRAGLEGQISINNVPRTLTIPDGPSPELIEHQDQQILLITTDLARRTWPIDDLIVLGPEFVGRTMDDVLHADKAKQYHVYSLSEGKLSARKITPSKASSPTAPRLGKWDRFAICPEPVDANLPWRKLDRPRDVDKIGIHYGYAWYRIPVEHDRPKKRNLFLPDCADRATLYLDGELIGTWGPGPDATRDPLPVSFKKGEGNLVVMVDNLGRFCRSSRLGEPKGLYGHIWDAKPLKTRPPKIEPVESFPHRLLPRNLAHLMDALETQPITSASFSFNLPKASSVHLRFSGIPHHVAVVCNDRPVEFFARQGGTNWGNWTFGPETKKGKNTVELLIWGALDEACLKNVELHSLIEPISADGRWSALPWTALPETSAREPIKGKGCWYRVNFKADPDAPEPLFFWPGGVKKGQIFLNGWNVGRYWNIGPQEWYYLPECYLAEDNELVLFEENGNPPQQCKLKYSPPGPYG